MRANILKAFCFTLSFAAMMPGSPQGQGSVIAAPTAAAYANLTSASNKILIDLRSVLPQTKTIILYDAPTFSVVPYYASTTDLVRTAANNICNAEAAASPRTLIPTLDVGTAAQGLAGLIQLTIPSYAVQGQNLALDNSALVGSFATAAKAAGYHVVNPTYLLPAVSQVSLDCQKASNSSSLADLWTFANREANAAKVRAESKKSLSDALVAFQKFKDIVSSPSDKGAPLLARTLTVESLALSLKNTSEVAVIDMRLDAADIDSTTKSVLWWRKTKFSANVAAHYWIFSTHGTSAQFGIELVEPGSVNILQKNVDLAKFTVSR